MSGVNSFVHGLNKRMFVILSHINPEVSMRPSTRFAKEHFKGKKITCAEIGVSYGDNALNILSILNIKKIFLIDPYEITKDFPQGQQIDWAQNKKPEEVYKACQRKLNRFNDKIKFLMMPSSQAIDSVRSYVKKLDFIYIDGNHQYKYVKKDLELYFPLLKKKGIIAGDDFSGSFPGLCKAVLEFSKKNKLEFHGEQKDWWFIK